MIKRILWVTAAFAALVAQATADAVDDVRAGTSIVLDVRNINFSYSGVLIGDGAGVIDDAEAPATCVQKQAGSLDIVLNARDLGYDFDLQIPVTGTKVDSDTIRWTADSRPNVCITATFDNQTVDLLVKRISGRITANVTSTAPFADSVCGRTMNVTFVDEGGDAQNFIDIEAYLFCEENFLTRVDFRLRNFDYVGTGGIEPPAINVAPSSFLVQQGNLDSGALSDLLADDNLVVRVTQRAAASPATPNVGMLVVGNASVTNGSALRFFLRATSTAAPASAIIQRIELFNYDTNAWERLFEGNPSGSGEQLYSVNVTTDPGRFISSTGELSARLRWFDRGAASPGWRVLFDQVGWTITP